MGIKRKFIHQFCCVGALLAAASATLWAQTRVPLIYSPPKEQKSRNTQVLQNATGAEALEVYTTGAIASNRWLLRKKINDVPSWWGIFSGQLRYPVPADLYAFELDSATGMHFFREVRLYADSGDAQKQFLPGEVPEIYFNGHTLLIQKHKKLYFQENGVQKSIVALEKMPPLLFWESTPVAGKVQQNGETIAQTGEAILLEEGYHLFTIQLEEHYSFQRVRHFHNGEVFSEVLKPEPLPKWQNGEAVSANITLPEPGIDLVWIEQEMIRLQTTLQKDLPNAARSQKLIEQLQHLHQMMSTDTLRALFDANDLYFEAWNEASRSLPFLLNVGHQHFDFQLRGNISVSQAEAREILWYLDHQKQRHHPLETRRQRFRKVPVPQDYAQQNAWVEVSYINRQARARRHDRDQLMFFELTGARLLLPGRNYSLTGTWKFPSFIRQTREWQESTAALKQ